MAEWIDRLGEKWKGLHPLIRALMLIGLLIGGTLLPAAIFYPSTPEVGGIQTLYMWNVQHTVNGLQAYVLANKDDTAGYSSVSKSGAGDVGVSWSIDVIIRHANESEYGLGSKVAEVIRSASDTGSGIQSATWTCPDYTVEEGDALKIVVYIRIGTGSWLTAATFISPHIYGLTGSTWTVYYYTKRSEAYNPKTGLTTTYGYFYWGSSAYHSRIENVDITFAERPKYTNVGKTSADISTETATFYTYWNMTEQQSYLDSWKFYWRNQSESWTLKDSGDFPPNTYETWSNVTVELPAGGQTVEWCFWANSTNGNYNQTSTQSFWCWRKLPNVLERVLGSSFGGSLWNGAIFYNGTAGGTAAVYVVFSNSTVSPWEYQIAAFDLNSETWTDTYAIADSGGDDTHWNPCISVLPDGRLIVLYGYLTTYYRISTYNATTESNLTKLITNWEPTEYNISNFNYPDPLRWDDKLVLFGRTGSSNGGNWTYLVWNGTAFTNRTDLVYFNVPDISTSLYAYATKAGNNILLGFTRREYAGDDTGVYMIYSDDRGNTWKLVDGTVKTPPINGSECLVVNSSDPTQAGAPFLDENSRVVIPVRHDDNIWLAQYSNGLGATGTWTYQQIKFENGTLMNCSLGGLVFMNDPYYGRPSGWVSIDSDQNRLNKIVRVPNTTHNFRVVWTDEDYTDVKLPKTSHYFTNVLDAPEAYEVFLREQYIGALSNLQVGSELFTLADENTLYGVKLNATVTGRLMGVSVYFNLTGAQTLYFQAALYNESLHLLDEGTEIQRSYSNQDIVAWSTVSTLDYTITVGTTYWLVFRFRHTGTNMPDIFRDDGGTNQFFSIYHEYPYPFPSNITNPIYANKTCTIKGFFSVLVVRGVGRKFPTNLQAGWNSFYAWNVDVGHTLAQVNASLWIDNVNWTVITLEYANGTRVSLVYDQGEYIGYEAAAVESTDDKFWIYCLEVGEWYHVYP